MHRTCLRSLDWPKARSRAQPACRASLRNAVRATAAAAEPHFCCAGLAFTASTCRARVAAAPPRPDDIVGEVRRRAPRPSPQTRSRSIAACGAMPIHKTAENPSVNLPSNDCMRRLSDGQLEHWARQSRASAATPEKASGLLPIMCPGAHVPSNSRQFPAVKERPTTNATLTRPSMRTAASCGGAA